MQIRDADAHRDAGPCAAIYSPYVRDTVVSLEEEPPDAAELTRRIETVSTRYPWLVAERDEVVVGFAYASRHRDRASYRWAADVSVYVDQANQRRGVGRALYLRLFELMREQNLQVACAGISLPNLASVALHESVGFELVGIYRRIGYKHGAWVDVGWWQLALGAQTDAPPEIGPRVCAAQPPSSR